MGAQSNERLNLQIQGFNTGRIPTGFNPSIPVAVIVAPLTFAFTPTNMLSQSAFITALNALTQNNTRAGRGFALYGLDEFKDETKTTPTEDTGIYQLNVLNFPGKFSFRWKTSQANMNNFQETIPMSDSVQFGYGIYIIDQAGNVWGTLDPTGTGNILPYNLSQFWVPNWSPKTASKNVSYMFTVSLASQAQMNINFAYYVCPTLDPNALLGLENVVLQQAPSDVLAALTSASIYTAATDICFIGKMGQDSADFVQTFAASLTAGCFKAYNYSTSASATIASIHVGVIVVASGTYNYVDATLSGAPASTNKVGIFTDTPSAVNAIITGANVVTEIIQAGVDGQRAAVKTFA